MSDSQENKEQVGCQFPACGRHPLKNGMCVMHQQYASARMTDPEKEPMNNKSKKLAKEERKYSKIVKEMLDADPLCELKVPGVCTNVAEGLHHQKRRGINLLNRKYLKRACNACNLWCEKHPREAIKLGLSVSVHKK